MMPGQKQSPAMIEGPQLIRAFRHGIALHK
jgi:hypothetical protein